MTTDIDGDDHLKEPTIALTASEVENLRRSAAEVGRSEFTESVSRGFGWFGGLVGFLNSLLAAYSDKHFADQMLFLIGAPLFGGLAAAFAHGGATLAMIAAHRANLYLSERWYRFLEMLTSLVTRDRG